jgi:hypothetical protein
MGWPVDAYREAFGLNARRPLQAGGVSEAQERALRRRMVSDKRIRKGMTKGLQLARSGELAQMSLHDLRQTGVRRSGTPRVSAGA